MIRREFLKLTGLFSVAFFIPIPHMIKATLLPVEVESQGKLYRGTSDGRIYISANQGRDWELYTDFGSKISISNLSTDHRGQVHAQLDFAGYTFELALAQEKKSWRTI